MRWTCSFFSFSFSFSLAFPSALSGQGHFPFQCEHFLRIMPFCNDVSLSLSLSFSISVFVWVLHCHWGLGFCNCNKCLLCLENFFAALLCVNLFATRCKLNLAHITGSINSLVSFLLAQGPRERQRQRQRLWDCFIVAVALVAGPGHIVCPGTS